MGNRPGLLVVVGPGARDGGAAPSIEHLRAERRGLSRRVHDRAVRLAFEAAGPLCAAQALFYALGLGHLSLHHDHVLIGAWVGMAAASWSFWLVLVLLFRYGYQRQGDTRRWRRMLSAAILLNLLLVALYAWLPTDSTGTVRLGLVGLLGLSALVGMALPMLPLVAPLGVVLVAVDVGLLILTMFLDQGMALLLCALLALMATVLARRRQQEWFETQRTLMEQRERIQQLVQERDRARHAEQDKSRFIATASHDLRQPMHALGLFIATLEQRLRGGPETTLVRNMMRAVESLERSFTAVLDISRIDAGALLPNLQAVPLCDLFRRLHLHYAPQAEVAGLSLRLVPGGRQVWSDPQLLERILGNLIQNAIKYTRQGGVIVVARQTRTHINIEVWDTGIGITATELPHIFDEFYQIGGHHRDRRGGLGMGLAIVKRLVRLLGHTLATASTPGRGTLFRIGIAHAPVDFTESLSPGCDTEPVPMLFQTRRVLVIDDEESIRESLRLLLEEWGFEAWTAADLAETRRIVTEQQGGVDLLLCDLHLRDGEDGLEAIRLVRELCQQPVPAIVITGDTAPAEIRRANASGNPVLFKPVQPRQLIAALRMTAS